MKAGEYWQIVPIGDGYTYLGVDHYYNFCLCEKGVLTDALKIWFETEEKARKFLKDYDLDVKWTVEKFWVFKEC